MAEALHLRSSDLINPCGISCRNCIIICKLWRILGGTGPDLGGLEGRGSAALVQGRGERDEALHINGDAHSAHDRAHRRRPQCLQQPIIAPACPAAVTPLLPDGVSASRHTF